MNNNLAEIFVAGKKLFSYPEQILFPLLLQPNRRLYAGMSEEEVSARERALQIAEKTKVGIWQGATQKLLQLIDIASHEVGRHIVRHHGLEAAQSHPPVKKAAVVKALKQQ